MPSKMVTDRQRSAAAVEAAVASHSEETAAALGALLEPLLAEKEEAVDLRLLQALLGRLLADHRQALVRADEADLAATGDDLGARRRRDAVFRRLHERVVAIRRVLVSLYGVEGARAVGGFAGRTPRVAVALARLGRRLIGRFSEPGFALPASDAAEVEVDVGRWVAELEPPVEELEGALAELERERREAETTAAAKLAARDDFDRGYRAVVRVLEGLYLLAGRDRYAARLRPAGRRAVAAGEEEGAAEMSAAV